MWQIVINGPGYFDTPYPLPDGETHVGRADENDVVLTGDKVSRRHARFFVDGATVTVEDLGSRNGTQLNGQNLAAPATLSDGDAVTVGENTLAFRRAGEAEESRTEVFDAVKGPLPLEQAPKPLDAHAAELAGQVMLSRDLGDSAFLKSFDEARAMSVTELEQAAPSHGGAEKLGLALLYKVVEALSNTPSLDAFLQQMLDLVMEVAHARTGVVLLKNAKGTFTPVVVRHAEKLSKGEVPISDAVVAEVVQKKVALCVADMQGDDRFKGRESVILYGLNQVLCVPMMHEGLVIGLLYLNRSAEQTGSGKLGLESLLDLLTAIAQLSASGAQQARLKAKAQSEERIRRALERFHAPDVVEKMVKDLGKTGQVEAKVEEREVTIVFADICGFTEVLGRLPGPKVVGLINEFYRRMTRVIFSFGGTVDKFIGDRVMALFGAPYGRPDDATRAIKAALAMRTEFQELLQSQPKEAQCDIRIAIHTGKVLAGTIGSDARMEYTALGQAVNVAAHLGDTAEPGQILISGDSLDAAGNKFPSHPLGNRLVKGIDVEVHDLVEEDLEFGGGAEA